MYSSHFRIAWLLFVALASSAPTYAAPWLEGKVVLADSTPVAGAMITLTDPRGYADTVYSDGSGRWRLDLADRTGELQLRARAGATYRDSMQVFDSARPVRGPLTLIMQRDADPSGVSERLSASAHAAKLTWKDAATKKDFVSQCHFCHQIGNAWTRRARSESEWVNTIRRMEGYGTLITRQNQKDFAHTLAQDFNGQPVRAAQTVAMSPALARARIREWAFGGPTNYVHDVEAGPDGKLYGVDMGTDRLWILDPAKSTMEEIVLPANGLPLGGDFAGAVAPLGTFAAHHGPHSIQYGPDGRFYMTCSLSAEICIYDPRKRRLEFIAIGGDAIYPHTLRFDAAGTLWFTLALSNQIGRMDIRTRRIDLIDLPSNGAWRWMSDAFLPAVLEVASWFGKKDMQVTLSHHQWSGKGRDILNLPYGIDINPVDGSIWYSKLYAGYIGRIDPKTHAVEEYATPYSAPRRLRFDRTGTLWIPSFDTGMLMRFNAVARRFGPSVRLPTLADNEYETPYALAVHPKTQQVWIASNMSDRIMRFDPRDGTFVTYPSPTRVTYLRDFVFLPDGQVCSSNANLPAAAIEGGRPKLLCLDPDYREVTR